MLQFSVALKLTVASKKHEQKVKTRQYVVVFLFILVG